jgi:osmoprotectant transport system substrate-binding protein
MKQGIGLALAACLTLMLAACGERLDAGGGSGSRGSDRSLTVGSANFPENELLAEIYAGALKAKGLDVSTRLNIGSREALFPALERGDITVLPEYTGGLLTYVSKGEPAANDTAGQVTELRSMLPSELTLLEPSQAQDQNTVTCTREVVDRYSLSTLEDLAKVSKTLTLGGPPELAARDGFGSLKGLKAVYGIEFKKFQPLDVAGPLTVAALKDNKVQCANLFSTQSAIEANGFVSLADPKGFAQSEAIVPLIAKDAATPEVSEALDAVSGKLTTDNLKEMVKRVEVDKDDAETVAGQFLSEQGLN